MKPQEITIRFTKKGKTLTSSIHIPSDMLTVDAITILQVQLEQVASSTRIALDKMGYTDEKKRQYRAKKITAKQVQEQLNK